MKRLLAMTVLVLAGCGRDEPPAEPAPKAEPAKPTLSVADRLAALGAAIRDKEEELRDIDGRLARMKQAMDDIERKNDLKTVREYAAKYNTIREGLTKDQLRARMAIEGYRKERKKVIESAVEYREYQFKD